MNRWVVYQRERFPLLAHAPLVAAFSASAVCFSATLRGGTPDARALLVAFVTSLLFFLQLRISDEFKDAGEDARHRPYRPVPRGLVTLRELGWVAAAAVVIQAGLALWLNPSLLLVLLVPWTWLALMSREFFVGRALRRHPFAYAATHMAIVPLIDYYATACDWIRTGAAPHGLGWFLLVSFANGFVIEIGRKVRASQDEEPGVETYSSMLGRAGAVRAWSVALLMTALLAWQAATRAQIEMRMLVLLLAMLAGCAVAGWTFLRTNAAGAGRRIETTAGVWTLCLYLGLGVGPLIGGRSGTHDAASGQRASGPQPPAARPVPPEAMP